MRITRPALIILSLIITGCYALGAVAPPPAPTAAPTDTPTPAPTPTATPTLGPREFIDAVFCWPSPIDEGSFNLLRFFADGTVLDASVAPFADCQEAWNQMKQYLTIENTQTFNHGEYLLSGETIRFDLAAARSTKIIGEVTGVYFGDKMFLNKVGAENLEYTLVQP